MTKRIYSCFSLILSLCCLCCSPLVGLAQVDPIDPFSSSVDDNSGDPGGCGTRDPLNQVSITVDVSLYLPAFWGNAPGSFLTLEVSVYSPANLLTPLPLSNGTTLLQIPLTGTLMLVSNMSIPLSFHLCEEESFFVKFEVRKGSELGEGLVVFSETNSVLICRDFGVECSNGHNPLRSIGGLAGQALNNLKVYPNPVGDHVILVYSTLEPGPVSVQILDLSGRLLTQQSLPASLTAKEHQYRLKMDGLAQGAYLLRFQAGKDRQIIRLLKQ